MEIDATYRHEEAKLEATELVCRLLEESGKDNEGTRRNRAALARKVGWRPHRLDDVLNGGCTLKTLTAMLHAMGYRLRMQAEKV